MTNPLVTGLIGHTGFVGGNLDTPGRFTHRYNSRDFHDMKGQRFDALVCAGVSAAKWVANREPEEDWRRIEALTRVLDTVEASRFTLISTIDVYPDPSSGWDETARLDGLDNHAYGLHRLRLEDWARRRFPHCIIIRLPALFGPGLKKNALFDLMHGNMVDRINPASRFQWYPLTRLWDDMARIDDAGIPLVNLFTEPLAMSDVIDQLFPGAPVGPAAPPAPHYNLRTCHASLFGGRAGYMLDSAAVLEHMTHYVHGARGER